MKSESRNNLFSTHAFIVSFLLIITQNVEALIIEGSEYPSFTQVDTQFAQSHGVIFDSNKSFVIFGEDGRGVSLIYGTDPSRPIAAHFAPIELTFVDPADGITPGVVNGTISAIWGDGGGDVDYLRLRAYNYANVLLGTEYSTGATWQSISFTGNGIHKIVFDQAPGAPYSSDTALDNLSFPMPVAVPEPGTVLLFALGAFVLKRRNLGVLEGKENEK